LVSDTAHGHGGAGYDAISFVGSTLWLAGGGGGGIVGYNSGVTGGAGGSGVGGDGGYSNPLTSPTNAVANTGSGGGGAGGFNTTRNGGSGSAGRVIIRYPGDQIASGGIVTTATIDGVTYTIHTFLSSGTFTLPA
jgi:hypothetical protein